MSVPAFDMVLFGGTGDLARRKLIPASVSYTHLTLPTTCTPCRSRWSPYH